MTSDDGMDAQDNAWAQLARRIEKTERAVREMRDERNAAVDRANALAAHMEQLISHYATHDGGCDKMCGVGPCSCGLDSWLEQAPDTSLARLEAKCQATGMSWAATRAKDAGLDVFAEELAARAAELRRQASGDDS